jgi:cellobiose-specific phosphotransferase system component IIA
MKMLIGAAAFVAAFALPAAAQDAAQPSPFKALEVAQELQLSAQQQASINVARDSLRQAHQVHCAPMHASTPSEEAEARHHAEMALINARWEGEARAAMTPVQLTRLAQLRPVQPAAGEHAGDHHGAAPAPAAAHGAHPAPAAAPAAGHAGHHPAPAAAAKPAEGHAHQHPSR